MNQLAETLPAGFLAGNYFERRDGLGSYGGRRRPIMALEGSSNVAFRAKNRAKATEFGWSSACFGVVPATNRHILGKKWPRFCALSVSCLIIEVENPRVFDHTCFASATSACLREPRNNWVSKVRSCRLRYCAGPRTQPNAVGIAEYQSSNC